MRVLMLLAVVLLGGNGCERSLPSLLPLPDGPERVADDDDGDDDISTCGTITERCNGRDDDCDGLIDEDVADERVGSDEGECVAKVWSCIDGFLEIVQPGITPIEERCNGRDDDCDGLTDEEYPEIDVPCTAGVGACAQDGVVVCGVDGYSVVCSVDPTAPSAEVCDGSDNDCDGITDEDIAGRSCYDGTIGTAGLGICTAGVATCEDAIYDCTGMQTPLEEVCDRADNDCDGLTDEAVDTDDFDVFIDDVLSSARVAMAWNTRDEEIGVLLVSTHWGDESPLYSIKFLRLDMFGVPIAEIEDLGILAIRTNGIDVIWDGTGYAAVFTRREPEDEEPPEFVPYVFRFDALGTVLTDPTAVGRELSSQYYDTHEDPPGSQVHIVSFGDAYLVGRVGFDRSAMMGVVETYIVDASGTVVSTETSYVERSGYDARARPSFGVAIAGTNAITAWSETEHMTGADYERVIVASWDGTTMQRSSIGTARSNVHDGPYGAISLGDVEVVCRDELSCLVVWVMYSSPHASYAGSSILVQKRINPQTLEVQDVWYGLLPDSIYQLRLFCDEEGCAIVYSFSRDFGNWSRVQWAYAPLPDVTSDIDAVAPTRFEDDRFIPTMNLDMVIAENRVALFSPYPSSAWIDYPTFGADFHTFCR
ncbi:MAG: MopE-related protein [Candidatus Uhrbacteria bacterium]